MAEVKEHPILFNTQSVRWILSGQKTQTRRVMKPQPMLENGVWRWKPRKGWDVNVDHINPSMSPYGTFGDVLWVRETWRQGGGGGNLDGSGEYVMIEYRASFTTTTMRDYDEITYAQERRSPPDIDHSKSGLKWRSSIHIPRWASRITLEVLDVRVERVQDISEEDARAEGAEKMCLDDLGQTWKTYRRGFRLLWDAINKKRGFGWDVNPWVFVIEFKLL